MPENTPNRGYPVPVANDAFEPQSRINALGVAVDADVESVDSAKVDKTTTVTAGAGLTGGGDLSTNRTIAANVGTTAGTLAAGDDSRIVNAVQPARTITAGTGLTGGGDLSANRTLAVDFTAVATASQGAKADAAIPNTTVDAKGDLLVATADNTVTRLPAPLDGRLLVADSTQAAGYGSVRIGNILHPNLATGTDLLGTIAGIDPVFVGTMATSSTAQAYRGTRSLKIEWTDTTNGRSVVTTEYDVIGGYPYTFAFRSYRVAAGRRLSPQIVWYDAAGAQISAPTTLLADADETVGAWVGQSIVEVSPANAVKGEVRFRGQITGTAAAGDVHYVDDVMFVAGATDFRFWQPPNVSPANNQRVKPGDPTVMQIWNPQSGAWQDLSSSTVVPSHASTHAVGGTDAITPAAIGAATSAQGSLADSAVQPGDLATVATSGDYDDLTDKRVEIGVACSDETTALTTGTAKVTFRMPYAMTLTAVRASVTTAPVGATITVDINESGSSVLSTKLTIDDGEKTSTTAATAAVISDSALADDAEITIDIDQVGSSTAGAGLKMWLIGTRA